MSATDKLDVVRQVEEALAADPKLVEQFNWLLKVWNTDDDRAFEEFDPTTPYGSQYVPEDDEDDERDEEKDGEEKLVSDVPELQALRLVTVYGDGSTTLVSVAHRAVIADFDGERPQSGIPHLHLTPALEQEVGRAFWGADWTDGDEGFPGWPAVFAYLSAHPEVYAGE